MLETLTLVPKVTEWRNCLLWVSEQVLSSDSDWTPSIVASPHREDSLLKDVDNVGDIDPGFESDRAEKLFPLGE